jgi:hypothetical protein
VNLLFGVLLLLQTANAPAPQPAPAPAVVDRNAFTFTEYRLQATLDPAKHGIGVEGDVTLRNDSDKPQALVPLQISSSLEWKGITIADAPAKYAVEKLGSDIDHTGAVNEARVTVEPVAPKASITIHVVYAGTIELGSERLRRLGTPPNIAEQNDWDRIGSDITAFRGVGYVTWYPVSIEPSLFSEGNTTFERVAQWKGRHQQSGMTLSIRGSSGFLISSSTEGGVSSSTKTFAWDRFGMQVPVLISGSYESMKLRAGVLFYLKGSEVVAQKYVSAYDGIPPATDGPPKYLQKIVQLPASFTPFESSGMFLTSFSADAKEDSLKLFFAHTAAHAYFYSDRAWLNEGFAHWSQLQSVNDASGRKTALAMLQDRESGLALADSSQHDPQPLTTAYDELFYRTKATYVWWMLADMVGEDKLLAAVKSYVPALDKEPSYFQRLVEKESGRGLEQFFDDWVYRDKGLADFRITEVFPRQNLNGGFMITVTVENTGRVGAEVPITARGPKNIENSARVWVPGGGKASARIVMPLMPTEIIVNDGSIPEIDPTDNVYTVAPKPNPTTPDK